MNFIAQEKLSLIYFFLTFDKNKMSLHDFVMYVCFRCVWVVHWENISKLLIRLKKQSVEWNWCTQSSDLLVDSF